MSLIFWLTLTLVFIASCIALLGLGLLASRVEALPVLAIPCFVSCSVVVAMYGFGLLGILEIGQTVIFALGILAIPFWILTSFDATTLSRIMCVFGFPMLLTFALISSDHQFWVTDEFTHWGLALKSVVLEGSLWNQFSPVLAKNYPPGQTLFQFYFAAVEEWHSASVTRAQTLFVVFALLSVIAWNVSLWSTKVISFTIIFVLPLTLGLTYGVLLPDVLQAYLFASAVAALSQRISLSRLIAVAVMISTLVLLKETGSLLAVVLLVLVWSSSRLPTPESNRKHLESKVSVAVASSALLLPTILWQIRLQVLDISGPLSRLRRGTTPSNLTDTVEGRVILSPTKPATVEFPETGTIDVFAAVWGKINSPFFPTMSLVPRHLQIPIAIPQLSLLQVTSLGVMTHFLMAIRLPRAHRRQLLTQATVMTLGALFFILVHALLYLLFFSQFEARQAGGLERYYAVYLIAWLAVLTCLVVAAIETNTLKATGRGHLRKLLTAVSLIATLLFGLLISDSKTTPQPPFRLRAIAEIEKAAAAIRSISQRDDAIFFLYEEPTFMRECQYNCGVSAYHVFRYAMAPNTRISKPCASFVEPNPAIGDCRQEFDAVIGEYDFLVLMNATKASLAVSQKLELANLNERQVQIFKVVNTRDTTALEPLPGFSS